MWGDGMGVPMMPLGVPTAVPTTVPQTLPYSGGSFGAPVAVAANGQVLASPGGSMMLPVAAGGSLRVPVGTLPGTPVGSVGVEPLMLLASGPGSPGVPVTPVAYGQQRLANPPGSSVIRPRMQPGQVYA